MRAALIAVMLMIGSQAGAFFHDKDLTRDSLSSFRIYVAINDYAEGGCWTNLREARQYAEEKLRSSGFDVVQDGETSGADVKKYFFHINVNGQRVFANQQGPCVGNVEISMSGWTRVNKILHIATIGEMSWSLSTRKDNMNRLVLQRLSEVFLLFPK